MEYGKVSFFMDRFFLKSNFKCLGTTWYLSNLSICAGEVFFSILPYIVVLEYFVC